MPLYEYRCRSCKKVFEEIVSPSDDETQIACPICGEKKPERQVSAFATCAEGGKTTGMPVSACRPRGGFS